MASSTPGIGSLHWSADEGIPAYLIFVLAGIAGLGNATNWSFAEFCPPGTFRKKALLRKVQRLPM